ncbi:MAG TPA: ribonuclease P protein component [Clostridiales bacterium]|jgi:ribonuclease P protein component|nr:ribonuclease P protein component [Clostridiales bacterium]
MKKPDVLRKDEDFADIYRKRKSAAGKYVVVFYRKNQLPYNRQAFLASKKVGKSVQRNRARRLMKESYRQMKHLLPTGWDFIFIARHTILDTKCEDVRKSMEAALKRTGILK